MDVNIPFHVSLDAYRALCAADIDIPVHIALSRETCVGTVHLDITFDLAVYRDFTAFCDDVSFDLAITG